MSENEQTTPRDSTHSDPPEVAEVIGDLLVVAKIPSEQIEAAAIALLREPGFLDDAKLGQLLAEKIHDREQATIVQKVLARISVGSLEQLLGFVGEWRNRNTQNAARFSDDAYVAIQTKLPSLIRTYPALQRFWKARTLSSATGNIAESAWLICDVRPVFDEQREVVEGLIPLTILRLNYWQPDNQKKEFEVYLPSSVLNALIVEGQKAQQKLAVLKSSVDTWLPHGFVGPP